MQQQWQTYILIFLILTGFMLAITDHKREHLYTDLAPKLDNSPNEAQRDYEKRNAPAEPWITELIRHTEEIPYAQALVCVQASGEYDIKWQEFKSREGFLSSHSG